MFANVKNAVFEKLNGLRLNYASEVKGHVAEKAYLTKALSTMWSSSMPTLEDVKTYVTAFPNTQNDPDNCYVCLPDSTLIDKANVDVQGIDLTKRQWYQEALTHDVFISDVYTSISFGDTSCVTVSAKVENKGKLVGVLGFDYKLSFFETIIQNVTQSLKNVDVIVLQKDGTIIAFRDYSSKDNILKIENGSREVMSAIKSINAVTPEVKDGSAEMLRGGEQVADEMKKLDDLTRHVSDRMNEMAAGAVQINRAVPEVNEMTQQNRESSEALVVEVGKFKVE